MLALAATARFTYLRLTVRDPFDRDASGLSAARRTQLVERADGATFALLARVGPTRTQLIGFLIPVVALLAGVILLGEPVGAGTLTGLAVIFAGVALVVRPQPSSSTGEPSRPGRVAPPTAPTLPAGPLYDRHSRRRIGPGRGAAAGL